VNDKSIPVINKADNSVHWISMADINYTSLDERHIVYHTEDGIYHNILSLEDLTKVLAPVGFEKLDRGNLVQIEKITYYDSVMGKVYFDEVITKDTRYTTVAPRHMSKIKELLGKEKDIGKPRSFFF